MFTSTMSRHASLGGEAREVDDEVGPGRRRAHRGVVDRGGDADVVRGGRTGGADEIEQPEPVSRGAQQRATAEPMEPAAPVMRMVAIPPR